MLRYFSATRSVDWIASISYTVSNSPWRALSDEVLIGIHTFDPFLDGAVNFCGVCAEVGTLIGDAIVDVMVKARSSDVDST